MATCTVPQCGNTISESVAAHTGMCSRCNHSLYYWTGREDDYVRERMEKLSFWQDRLAHFSNGLIRVRRKARAERKKRQRRR